MQQPIEIDVDEQDQIVTRVAGIDVAKASGMVCTRVPHETITGRRVSKVWEVKTDTAALLELADHLICQGIERRGAWGVARSRPPRAGRRARRRRPGA